MAEKKLTREQARELYDDLHKAMSQMMTRRGQPIPSPTSGAPANSQVAKEIADAIKAGLNGKPPPKEPRLPAGSSRPPLRMSSTMRRTGAKGQAAALVVLTAFCMAKVTLAAIEASGVIRVETAQALVVPRPAGPEWSKEEAKVLTQLDHRRAELEERTARIEQRETELAARDRDMAVKLNEIKELTERLKIEREKGDKQRNSQLDQLANVYGSMNPPEAAHLLEQLDIHVALSLVERMPEKRIGQILSLMNPQRALELTNILSRRTGK